MKDFLYQKSPNWMKSILLNLKAYLNRRNRYSSNYLAYLEQYIINWTDNKENIKLYQGKELKTLLLECYDFVEYYRNIFEELNINKFDIECNPYYVLNQLPILEKSIRKNKVALLVNSNPDRKIAEIGYTSGTSGAPTINYLDKESIEKAFGLWARFHRVIGINKKDRSVRFSGRLIINPSAKKPPFWMYNYFDKQLFMSSYHLREGNILFYLNKLNKYKPALIDGFPSAIYILAKYINKNSFILKFTPKAIATTAETLYDYQRKEIETAFHCKVFNQYASSEGSPFITECKAGKLHVNEDSGVFEYLDQNNNPAKAGDIARLVVTSFRNWKTPLIRYDIQDNILLPLEQELCACGCSMPYVDSIVGRVDDVLWTKEKGYVARFGAAFYKLKGIIKSQLIQTKEDNLRILLVIDDKFTVEEERELIKNIKDRLGETIKINIEILDDIPNGPNGKYKFIKREFEIK